MNLPNGDRLQADFERSLERTLKNWVRHYAPPQDARANLLAAAEVVQRQRSKNIETFFESWSRTDQRSRDLAMLFYAPQLSNMAALMHF